MQRDLRRLTVSDPSLPSRFRGTRRREGGQSLVEFALVFPVVVLVLLMAIDFGRVYIGWVSVNGMARVGANFAAMNPDAWAGAGDASAQAEYQRLMTTNGNVGSICPTPLPAPVFGSSRAVGQSVRVTLDCDFPIVTPIISNIVGGAVAISGSSTFPISRGCLADCPPPPPLTTPPPAPDHCRTVPTLTGLSISGARRAWENAGFNYDNFSAPADAVDSDTVASQTVTIPPDGDYCDPGKAFFGATVTVTTEPVPPPPDATCRIVPNVLGMTVADARTVWSGAGFTGAFTPAAGADDQLVLAQTTAAPADPGACVVPETTMTVTYGEPPPPAPDAPCKVPGFVNTSSSTASSRWTTAGFASGNITFDGRSDPFTILSQTLVGGTWVYCDSTITVSDRRPRG